MHFSPDLSLKGMSALAESINIEERLSALSLNGKQAGPSVCEDNLFAPDSESELFLDENGTCNDADQALDPRVRD